MSLITLLTISTYVLADNQFCPLSGLGQKQHIENKLLVFVSFSMPEQSLRQLALQAREAGGVLVIRGLHNNSYKQTLKKIYQISKEAHSGFVIDPGLFKEFEIEIVPTFVVRGAAENYEKVSGDVSLNYVLRFLEDSRGEQP